MPEYRSISIAIFFALFADAVLLLDNRLTDSLDQHFSQLSHQIEWTHLAVRFQTYIDLLTFTLEEQTRTSNMTDKDSRLWALQAMRPGHSYGLSFWLDQYDMMMTGEGHLRAEKPLLRLFMESASYKLLPGT